MATMFLPLRRYADFEGRSRRNEFWLWQLFNFFLSIVLTGIFVATAWSAIERVGQRGGIYADHSAYSYTASYGGYSSSYSYSGNIDPVMLMEELGPESLIPLGLLSLWGLIAFIPGLAVAIRRLHDSDRSGWWLFISLVPLVGGIILLVFFFLDGTPGPNRFGPDPKGRHGGYGGGYGGGHGGYPPAPGYPPPPPPDYGGQRY